MKHVLTLLLLCTALHMYADTKWSLKKDQEGIKVYTGAVEGTAIKAVKVECMLDATPAQLTALLLDAKAHEKWVYSTKTSYEIKTVGDGHQVYYSELSMPWPLANRDVVVELKISQHPATKVMDIHTRSIGGHVPKKKDKVRVPLSDVHWTVTPVGNNKLKVDYIAQADPGGEIPAWAVNMFSTKGPFETFVQLRKMLTQPEYKNASFSFINN